LQVRQVEASEVTPFHGAFVEAGVAAGLTRVDNLDNPDGVSEVGLSPVNLRAGVRWNTALAYLDPVRNERSNLRIVGNALVDRVEIAGGRAVAVHLAGDAGSHRIEAQRVVVSAGAYNSPAVLLRSGIGPVDELRALCIEPRHPLAGVGRTLQDHSAFTMAFRGSPRLVSQMRDWNQHAWLPDEQALGKARSVTLVSPDPTGAPRIDHSYLSDPEGHDVAVLQDGVSCCAGLPTADRWLS
jgi:choline dehydrogenase